MLGKRLKAQSAMEYLMTYGWAILIIAVVLGALFSLGIFGGGAGLSNACVAVSGYECQSPVLNTAGTLSFTFGQNTGSTEYNVQLACAATSNAAGFPNPVSAFYWINGGTANQVAGTSSGITANTVLSGQVLSVSGLPCYTSSAAQLSAPAIGTSFAGSMWLNYTPSAELTTGNWLSQKIATITIKVT